MSPRTIAQIRVDRAKEYRSQGRPRETILDPLNGECARLFTSRYPDCLTHITRYIIDFPEWSPRADITHEAYRYAHGWCGVQMRPREIDLANASGFACAACIAACEKFEIPTYSLVPDTGCAVSGGKRGLTRGRTLKQVEQ